MQLPHPTWLRSFDAAARHGSFSAAADEIGLTPAAVSQQIRLLEKHLKTTLFERLPRGVSLTDMGKAYSQPVRKALDDMQSATSGLFGNTKRQQIKVRASISFAALIIAPRLYEFQATYPHIDLELSTFVWASRFQDGLSDIDVRFGHGDWTDGHVTHLGHEYATLVCRSDHLAGFKSDEILQELASGHIATIHGSESDWPQLYQQIGYDLPTAEKITRFDSSLMALQALSSGPGAAIVLDSFAQSFIAQGMIVSPIKDRLAIRSAHYLVVRENAEERDEIRAFSDWVRSIYLGI